ncbi:hypothetical protein [Streptomyces sp. NPDC050485]|uniref:hypothetical protein n=1 Tax=Streptomyces sp. NPDC050485 TaxID=3365617 RepID=UPI0037BCBF62
MTVEATESLDTALPLQLGEQRRGCHSTSKVTRGPDHAAPRASRPRTTIAELKHITVLTQAATSTLDFSAQPALCLFTRMTPLPDLVCDIRAEQRNGEIQEEPKLVNSIQWFRLTHENIS